MALFNVTNKKGDSSIKALLVSDTGFDSCSEPIQTDFNTNLFCVGTGAQTVSGDKRQKDANGVQTWT